jgi:hypothetical protein
MVDVEDLIRHRADEERSTPGLSFAPVYSFVAAVAYMARAQERQAIMDALPMDTGSGRSEDWRAGHAAAMAAIIRILAGRSIVV